MDGRSSLAILQWEARKIRPTPARVGVANLVPPSDIYAVLATL